MRKGVLAAAGSAFLAAAVVLSAAPAKAVPVSAPAALKGAGEAISLTENVCYGECGYYGGPRYYRPYYRPYYRSYSYYHRPYYRPYYRPHYGYGYGYRPVPGWVSGPYYQPRPRYYFGPNVYWY
jgi:hypothetical protein